MGEGEKIVVEIGGQQFRIVPPDGDADRLRRAAAYVEQKIATIAKAGVVSSQRCALLAALEIALELYEDHAKTPALSERDLREARTRLDHVIHKLNDAMTKSP
jgi:cell division protein ZapA (FtsZ GTPase activity inhibitor)